MVVCPAAYLAGPVAQWTSRAHLFRDGLADEGAFVRQLIQELSQLRLDFERDYFFLWVLLGHK